MSWVCIEYYTTCHSIIESKAGWKYCDEGELGRRVWSRSEGLVRR